jgi:hypothetical protein
MKMIDNGETRDAVDPEVWYVLDSCVLDWCVLNIFAAVYM